MTTYTLSLDTTLLGIGVINKGRVKVVKLLKSPTLSYPPSEALYKMEKATSSSGTAAFLLEPDDDNTIHNIKIYDTSSILVFESAFVMPATNCNLDSQVVASGNELHFKEDGTSLAAPQAVKIINFTGNAVSCAFNGEDTITVNIVKPDINNTLTSTSTTEGLSALKGKELKDGADALDLRVDAIEEELPLKLNAQDYVQHFKGKYTTLSALQTAHTTGNEGDYAIVDGGIDVNAKQYIWDNTDSEWAESGITPVSSTDEISEGSSNLYFTAARVRDALLTGLSLLTGTAISATDTVLSALGKLQKQISDLTPVSKTENFTIACSDRSTAITIGTNKMSFRNVGARKLTTVRASLDTAGTGTATTIDINVNGTSIFSTVLSIDATEETSVTAQTPFVFKTSSHSGWSGSPNYQIDDNAKVSIDFDAVGTDAKGLDVAFLTERV